MCSNDLSALHNSYRIWISCRSESKRDDVVQYLLEASPPSLVVESRRASYVFPIPSRNATNRFEPRSALSPFRRY